MLLPPAYQLGIDLGSDSRKSVTAGHGVLHLLRSSQDIEGSVYANVQYGRANVLVSVGPKPVQAEQPVQYVMPSSNGRWRQNTYGRITSLGC